MVCDFDAGFDECVVTPSSFHEVDCGGNQLDVLNYIVALRVDAVDRNIVGELGALAIPHVREVDTRQGALAILGVEQVDDFFGGDNKLEVGVSLSATTAQLGHGSSDEGIWGSIATLSGLLRSTFPTCCV